MPLLSLARARLAYGHVALLDDAEFQLDARERVGLIGRNGTGKSSLLRVLAGQADVDEGELWMAPQLRIAFVPQEPDLEAQLSVYDAVALGLGAEGRALAAYHHAAMTLAEAPQDSALAARLDALQTALERSGGWTLGNRVDAALSRLELAPDAIVGTLSGGWKKRVALAQSLAPDPDILLLDEPTNHLDLTAIAWLETLLAGFDGAVVCVTHDRRFLDSVATRIVELDRGRLASFPGSYDAYRQTKARQLAGEAMAGAKFDKLLAQEEVWIRKGIEARRTRNEGRVRRLEALRRERAARRERLGQVNLQLDAGERSGQMVAELAQVTKSFGGAPLIRDFSMRVLRGDRLGLIGPNGAGKTTLLRLILGELAPDSGTVRRGANLAVAYFDQLREALDPDATVLDTISPGAEFVTLGSERKHVMSYLGDFLFAPERARSPVRSLSGGEHNRLLLARLFAQPANLLVLDEPTNDLDIDTLELLEALLQDYRGTIFLISHDRAFLDNVVTQVIAFEGDGKLVEYVGGYSDWAAYQARRAAGQRGAAAKNTLAGAARSHGAGIAPKRPPRTPPRSGRTVDEQRELDALPARIEALESRLAALHQRFADPLLYRDRGDAVAPLRREQDAIESELAAAYARWEELEGRAAKA